MAKKFNSFNADNMAKKYAMKAFKQQQKEQERAARKEAERLLKEQQKPFVENWYKATRKLSSRITYLRNKGYDIEYNTIKPKVITQEDIDYINSLKSKQLLELQSNNLIDIQVSKTDKPTAVNSNRFNPKMARKELNELGFDDDFIDSALSSEEFSGLKDYYDFIKGSAEEIKEGQEDYGEEYPDYSDTSTEYEIPEANYYKNPKTGEIFSEDDPRIWTRNKRTKGKHIRIDLEYHSNEPLTGDTLEGIKWSNFFSPYDTMKKSSYIHPRDFYENLHENVSTDELISVLSEMDEAGSNIGTFEFWYSEEFESFFEKLNDLIDRIEKKYDKDLSRLREDLQKEHDNWLEKEARMTRRNFT